MTDSSITLLEVHLGDGNVEIGPFELFGATDDPVVGPGSEAAATDDGAGDDGAGDDGAVETDGGCRARSVGGLLLALAALVAVAIGVARLRGDDAVPSGVAGDD